MRGTLEVSSSSSDPKPAPEPALSQVEVPLYVSLGLNLDAPHDSPVIPIQKPSAAGGQHLSANLSVSQFISPNFYRAHSPYQTWLKLRNNSSLASLGDQQLWNIVAFIWQSSTTPEALGNGRQLFAQNCAACHGENGAGNGVLAEEIQTANKLRMQSMLEKNVAQGPADFTDSKRLLGASPALLQGKFCAVEWGPVCRLGVQFLWNNKFGT